MKILMIHNDMSGKGGAIIYVEAISNELKKIGHKVKIISYPKKFLNMKNSAFFFNKELYFYFKNKIIRFKPDIIHIHNTHKFQNSVYLICFLYSKMYGCKVVKTFHDYSIIISKKNISSYYNMILNEYIPKYLGLSKIIEKYLLKNFYSISPNNELKRLLSGYGIKSEFIPNPISINKKKTYKKINDYTLLYIGTLDKIKGVKTAIKSMQFLPKKYKLIILGGGGYDNHLKIISKPYKRIKFIGWKSRDKIGKYIANSYLVIVPSIVPETGPMVVIEAMFFGKPVIGSNMGGIKELVTKNKIGLLFEPGNEEDLAKKIDLISNNKKLYDKFSKNALKSSKKYMLERHMEKLISLYNS
ncbi:MAG: glycosyltransferase family 4 protein [Candidatus Pacearchaeota archaeon]